MSLYTHLSISFSVPASWVFSECQGSLAVWEPLVGKKSKQTDHKQNEGDIRKEEKFETYKPTDKTICWNYKKQKFI